MIKHEPQIREYVMCDLMAAAKDLSSEEFESELQRIFEQLTEEELAELLDCDDE